MPLDCLVQLRLDRFRPLGAEIARSAILERATAAPPWAPQASGTLLPPAIVAAMVDLWVETESAVPDTISINATSSAYLLTWTEPGLPTTEYNKWVREIANGGHVDIKYTCGNSGIVPGDRVYLIRQRDKLNGGIAAAGFAVGKHFVDKNGAKRVPVRFSEALPLSRRLSRAQLDVAALEAGPWNSMQSGVRIPQPIANELERVWQTHRSRSGDRPPKPATGAGVANVLPVTVVPSPDAAFDQAFEFDDFPALEGAVQERITRHRRRERWKRDQRVRHVQAKNGGRLICEVPRCGFSFLDVYGEVGREYAQVHHLDPLSSGEEPRETRLERLRVVCANCHAMIHRGGENRDIDSLIVRREKAGA